MLAGMRTALLFTLALTACRTAEPVLQRAIINPPDVEAAATVEKDLATRYDVLPQGDETWFEILPGTAKVLIVAGHATAQTREGALKGPDRGTGSLAVALARLTNAPTIYTTRRSPSDPNYYDDNAFKAEVARLVADKRPVLVLDLHASHSMRPYDIDFGVMGGRSLQGREDWLTRLSETLKREGLINQSRDFFAAARNQTVTKFVSERGVPAIQLEISATWLDAGGDPLRAHRFAQLLQGLVRFIRSVDPAAVAKASE
jgi:hypothetical protein